MPRFSVAFGRRRSTVDSLDNAGVTGSSFRVLERAEVISSKPFDGGARLTAMTHSLHKSTGSDVTVDDNIFADLKSNRGSGSSNTTKTTLTDNSSRHSNASTAPSSADTGPSDDWRNAQRKPPVADIPLPPIPKSSSTGFLRAAGRTFSFGGQKKHLPAPPTIDESPPPTPPVQGVQTPPTGRPRAPTSSTSTTVTPPRVDEDFDLDLGGDFGKMLLGNDKRASMATLRNDKLTGQVPAPRSLTGPRSLQPTPIQIDKTAKVEPAPHSWSSQHSNDQLITSASPSVSPALRANNNAPLPPSRDPSPLLERQRPGTSPEVGPRRPLLAPRKSDQEEGEDEEARLLKDSLSTVTRFMKGQGPGPSASSPSVSRYRRDESGLGGDDDSLFDSSPMYSASKLANRPPARQHSPSPVSHKVMTPAEFERYRKDKERQDREREIIMSGSKTDGGQDEEDNYEDDEDDVEKAKQQAKQRRKQEAHMSVYRQQMMKVTGESGSAPSRPSLQMSFSTPNLPNVGPATGTANTSENSDEDEEVPLAILAAHGFPNRARPPNRLSTMASNPNLRASQLPSFQRPMSVVGGDAPGAANPRLPAFARNLPRDPFVGAGLVRNPVRESFALGGGGPAPGQPGTPVPPGGLVGVIANEERNRALRRGSPHLDGPSSAPGTPAFDPVAGIPAHMMYPPQPTPPVLTPGDQAQIQMTQQMQQFMQMQMQFMSMIAGQNGNAAPPVMAGAAGPHHLTSPSMGNLSVMGGGGGMATPEMMRHSFIVGGGNDSMLDLAPPYGRVGDAQMRTMSMVQPSSASWIQPAQQQPPLSGSFAPSIRISGGMGVGVGGAYAPSIAPSERSNIGLPGRYRPVSHVPPPSQSQSQSQSQPQPQVQFQLQQPGLPGHLRKLSTMSTALHQPSISVTRTGGGAQEEEEDDEEEGWEAMKAKREKKKSMWRAKKSIGDDISALIS